MPSQADGSSGIILPWDDPQRDSKLYRHDLSGPKKSGRDAIFLFPENYNLLRQELSTYWESSIWPVVAWRMAYRPEEFVEEMNNFLGLRVEFDTEKVDFISKTYLDALRSKRGVQ